MFQHVLYLVIADGFGSQYIFRFCKNLEKNPKQFCAQQLVGVEEVRAGVNILSYDSVQPGSHTPRLVILSYN